MPGQIFKPQHYYNFLQTINFIENTTLINLDAYICDLIADSQRRSFKFQSRGVLFTGFSDRGALRFCLEGVCREYRMENPGKLPLTLIEVQTGSYFGEDDIIRYEDVYARGQGVKG